MKRRKLALLLGTVLFLLSVLPTEAQISVTPDQSISFGAFYQGNKGGTVSISPDGARTVTGDVIEILQGIQYLPAIFVVDAPVGTVITIQNGPDVALTGNNGGSMTLSIGSSSTGSPFTTTTPQTRVSIGATLTVGSVAASPSGVYNGSLSVTFIQQ
ncbi:MAG: hypothetical protein A2066_09480 [Bacteroidetes bacterium GWB2_41_8]|nr:MAG: hypothetical protein A2066_09480 [Bacteroidetes bacterium GWB2_41_8]